MGLSIDGDWRVLVMVEKIFILLFDLFEFSTFVLEMGLGLTDPAGGEVDLMFDGIDLVGEGGQLFLVGRAELTVAFVGFLLFLGRIGDGLLYLCVGE
jgi:hypothetical protein